MPSITGHPFRPILLTTLAILMAYGFLPAQAETSGLFGAKGELWDRAGRLTDFSFAGYHSGDDPLPRPPVTTNVKEFGAKGDGKTDDTVAFHKAIEATTAGVIFIPAGRYLLTDILEIEKPHIVLRGEGPGQTILFYPKGLEEIRPSASATSSGRPTTAYSWSGGLISVKGSQQGETLGHLSSRAERGTRILELDKAPQVQPGDKIEVTQEDSGDDTLIKYFYNALASTYAVGERTSADTQPPGPPSGTSKPSAPNTDFRRNSDQT